MLSATAKNLADLAASVVLGAAEGEKQRSSLVMDAMGETVNEFERFAENVLILMVDIGLVLTFVALLLCIVRLLRGPTLIDRAVASDSIALQVVALVVLLSVRFSTIVDFDAVLIVSILGFVSTVAFAQFIGRRGAAA
jgi:multicomponent K+:H+ antiporter subunit F